MQPWQVVFRKEFREVFREARTRFALIISPLLITPLILALVGTMARKQVTDAQKETITVAVVNLDKAPTVRGLLKGAPNLTVVETDRPDAEAQIRARKVRAAAVLPDDVEQQIKEQRPVAVTILLDKGSQASQEGAGRLTSLFEERGKRLVASRLMENGLSQQLATPFATDQEAISGGSSASTLLLATFLPYVLAVSTLMGGVYLANNSVAGEKERGTLETLLVSPASRRDLVLGKFLAVASVSLVSCLLSLGGFVWPFYVKLPMFSWMTREGLSLHPMAVLAMLLVQIPLAVLGAGILLTISTFARNQKEAQTYLAPILLIVTVLAMTTMFLKAETPLYWTLVSVANAAMVVKQALEGVTNLPFLIGASVASLLYALCAVLFAAHAFQKESILLKA